MDEETRPAIANTALKSLLFWLVILVVLALIWWSVR